MFVDPAMLTLGANHSQNAAEHARAGARSLDQNTVGEGIFGSFAAADVFHRAISASHAEHVTALNDHQLTLVDLADTAHLARSVFTDMDQSNASKLRAVRCNSNI